MPAACLRAAARRVNQGRLRSQGRLRPRGMSARPSSTDEILFRFLDLSMLCRQEKFPSRCFRSVASADGDAAAFGTRPGLRSDGELPPAVEILSAFLDLSMLCKQENFPPASFEAMRPSLAMRAVSERGASRFARAGAAFGGRDSFRAGVPYLVALWLPRPYHFPARIQSFQVVAAPFPGDSVRRWRCDWFR